MGFLNNHKDAFRKSNSAWGDDNVTVYNIPNRNKSNSSRISNNMEYDDLKDMINEVSSIEPNCEEDEMILKSKLKSLSLEKEKRDKLENVTRIERDDAFEPKEKVIKEDVIKKIAVKSEKPTVSKDNNFLELEIANSLCDAEEPIKDNNIVAGIDTNTFLLAALIVVVVVKIID